MFDLFIYSFLLIIDLVVKFWFMRCWFDMSQMSEQLSWNRCEKSEYKGNYCTIFNAKVSSTPLIKYESIKVQMRFLIYKQFMWYVQTFNCVVSIFFKKHFMWWLMKGDMKSCVVHIILFFVIKAPRLYGSDLCFLESVPISDKIFLQDCV